MTWQELRSNEVELQPQLIDRPESPKLMTTRIFLNWNFLKDAK
jgi:hypothetical protein